MKLPAVLIATVFLGGLTQTHSYAQTGEPQRAEEPGEAYHTHRDTRHGHDHVYPDRGALIRDLPKGSIGVMYAGLPYRYHDGIWLEPRGPAFIVVAPPIGLVVPSLPGFVTVLARKGETYLYANDVYYRPRPDLEGYEVVNDPEERTRETTDLVGGAVPAGATAQATHSTGMQLAVVAPAPGATATVPGGTDVAGAAAASIREAPRVTATSPTAAAQTNAAVVPTPTGTPPAASSTQPPKPPKTMLYPKNGQSEDQQARDRYECYRFAVAQSGFDPVGAAGSAPAGATAELRSDFARAETACFDARGYTAR